MADIIKFHEYVISKEEEKKRIKKVSILSTRSNNIEGLLYSISNSIGCSLITKHFGEMNQVVGKETMLDPDMLNVIIKSLKDYDDKIHEQINELNSYGAQTAITC